ncbi:hypothetical protein BCV72DRAFT_14970 [Rhizopus microsporus var. microsporus]|uniref:Uncharacterized protein n=2 Tax=Rhizopus microsporus TaxID=58291 RepID=A0A2G4SN61_RHIZD|nr:uncharacterized protein RHIMIDRAFT_239685 [Rhizopus microsporus ATCC 52813]ORE10534.1 hypothetical protein BCV72DRAFT_14970 [Rhizopus microsporus var. microsporus]PHZ10209.1 hypothetical protein RHIMIDRAFT_239685 [Rhizopus microsporus ATCC 52813]
MSNKASHLKRLYKLFLKTGYAAVEGTAKNQKPMIKGLIRQGFDRYVYCTDPTILRELRPKVENTLELLNLAAKRNGYERDIVINLCRLKYHWDKYNLYPPEQGRKVNKNIKEVFDRSYDEFVLLKEQLNKDLNLCLPL